MASDNASRFSFRCLSLDLEVLKDGSSIRAFAGVRSDTDASFTYAGTRGTWAAALARLDDLADGADFLLGHNLIAFDLPHLRAADVSLRLLRLPPVDTLRLNPLAFPRNPYHHLVKHYQDGQLKRGRRNDPELDARLTLQVFENQLRAFCDAPPDLLAAWHWLTTLETGEGFDRVFAALRGSPRPSETEVRDALRAQLAEKSCQVQALRVLEGMPGNGWPLAYGRAWISVSGGGELGNAPLGPSSIP